MKLNVFREQDEAYQLVGALDFSEVSLTFAYDPAYLASTTASAVSCSLPLRAEPFSQEEASPFFAGLAPEGDMRRLVAESIHSDYFGNMLARLNNEPIGALIFSTDESVENDGGYTEIGLSELRALRDAPRETSFKMGMASRLSLAGAQSKVGLYHQGEDPSCGWYAPSGNAATTHIVKTPDSLFPLQTVNEALCLETAKRCGFDIAEWSLIPIEEGEPLLAVKRFDRITDETVSAENKPLRPKRLHQEDFCQATGLMPDMKYEPTSGAYLSRCCNAIQNASANPFGDRACFLQTIYFDYLIGNCDNHLKNHSLLWDPSWKTPMLSPLYDITCTTVYPQIYLEMGVSLTSSRRICDVSEQDIERAGKDAGIPRTLARNFYQELLRNIVPALDAAEEAIASAGFATEAHEIAQHIRKELSQKVKLS